MVYVIDVKFYYDANKLTHGLDLQANAHSILRIISVISVKYSLFIRFEHDDKRNDYGKHVEYIFRNI